MGEGEGEGERGRLLEKKENRRGRGKVRECKN
jgi:hypothetical protein